MISHVTNPCRQWTTEEREDVAEVVMITKRDDTGISYDVCVALRSLAAHAYEEGEDRVVVWSDTVAFGLTDATCGGGARFVEAARQQQKIADEIAGVVWGALAKEGT